MADQTITLDSNQATLLLKELIHLEKVRNALLKVIPESYSPKGSNLWWAKSDLEGLRDVKAHKYTRIRSHKELDQFLKNLK